MTQMTRREFAKTGLLALGAAATELGAFAGKAGALPTVRWGKHDITRLLLGHNPFKGIAHQPGQLGQEMKAYFDADTGRGVQLMRNPPTGRSATISSATQSVPLLTVTGIFRQPGR